LQAIRSRSSFRGLIRQTMNITILTSSYPRFPADGIASFIKSLAEALAAMKHGVLVLAPYDPAARDVAGPVRIRRFRYIIPDRLAIIGHGRSLKADVELKGPARLLIVPWLLVAAAQLVRAIRRHHADLIYAQWVLPSGFAAAIVARLTGVPLVIHLHGSDVYVAERYPVFRFLARWSFSQAEAVIACSDDLRNRSIRLGLSPHKSQVIPYGVDTARYRPGEGDKELRARLGIPGESPLIMAMGRLVHKKGFEFLLRAAPQVLAAFPKTHFLIAGEGDLVHQLVRLADELEIGDHVVFAGHIPWHENHRYLQLADVFAVPSIVDEYGNVDGLPNVLLEGMSTGLSIVASSVAGIPLVISSEENGLLVPEKDTVALAEAIIRLLGSPELRHALGRTARQTVISQHDWSMTASLVSRVLADAIRD
jgi:glycosyltransferase involved in cell wall biosynthesis